MEPSLSSTSLTNSSGSPTRALANGAEGVTKFFITAPFMTVGWRCVACRIQPIMPVTVDFPLVPPTATLRCASFSSWARNCGRVRCVRPSSRARTTSGTVSSTAAEVTSSMPGCSPDPSCGNSWMPSDFRYSNLCGVRPASSERSEPATFAPLARTMLASGNIPLPPIPLKKTGVSIIARHYWQARFRETPLFARTAVHPAGPAGTAHESAGLCAGVLAVLQHLHAVDEHVAHAGRKLLWLLERRMVLDRCRIEDHDVGIIAVP